MGLMIAGVGMLAYVSRQGLGSGPNLSLTVMYLGLIEMVTMGHEMGSIFKILLDNTGGDNKNNEMIKVFRITESGELKFEFLMASLDYAPVFYIYICWARLLRNYSER